jgi:hypothetical protein
MKLSRHTLVLLGLPTLALAAESSHRQLPYTSLESLAAEWRPEGGGGGGGDGVALPFAMPAAADGSPFASLATTHRLDTATPREQVLTTVSCGTATVRQSCKEWHFFRVTFDGASAFLVSLTSDGAQPGHVLFPARGCFPAACPDKIGSCGTVSGADDDYQRCAQRNVSVSISGKQEWIMGVVHPQQGSSRLSECSECSGDG